MSQINPKEKFNEITMALNSLKDEDVLSELNHHRLLLKLNSIGVKSEAITELEMLIHFYGNKHKEVVNSAKKLIAHSIDKSGYFHNITCVLIGFFEINLIIDYLEQIELVPNNQLNSVVTSNSILFYFIHGNLNRAKERFGAFFNSHDHARFDRLSTFIEYENLSPDDFNKIKSVISEIVREKGLRIIAIDHSYIEYENLFDIRVPTNVNQTFEINDHLFDKLYDSDLLRVQNILTYSFCPSSV